MPGSSAVARSSATASRGSSRILHRTQGGSRIDDAYAGWGNMPGHGRVTPVRAGQRGRWA